VREAPEGSVVLTEAFNCAGRAVYGELVSKYLLLYRQVAALVMCGLLRDAPPLIKERWPIWLEGVTPVGCANVANAEPLAPQLAAERRAIYDGSVAVCDDTGVVIIPRDRLTAKFLDRLDWIEEQEDIWFDCIDRLKMDTFETVCLKRYTAQGRAPRQGETDG
jgi:regulator of RNase E activity RraA